MSTFIDRIKALFGQPGAQDRPEPETRAHAGTGPHLSDAAVHNLMMALSMTRGDELSCGEVYALLDEYADHVVSDEDAAKLMPLVEHHLQMCKDCTEQYEALMRILETDEVDAS